MYRIPKDLDLNRLVGDFTTQLRVGQFDVQFSFSGFNFAVQSPIELFRGGVMVGHWQEGKWPDAEFYHVMNSKVAKCQVANDRLIVFAFENGLEMHLQDSSDEYESMQITVPGKTSAYII